MGKKKHTKEQIFILFSDERKNSKKSISWHEIISQYEIQNSKKRRKIKKEIQISMKILSELSVKCFFTGSLGLLSHATAKVISCYRNCTSHKLWSIYSLSFTNVFANFPPGKEQAELDGEKRRKCNIGKMQNAVFTLPAFDPQQGRAGQRSDFTSL